MKNFYALLRHEIRLAIRQKTEWASLLLFFIVVLILMPFALGPAPDILSRLAPGLIWIAVLLMSLLSLDRLFVQDARDGTLDEVLLSSSAFEIIIAAKILGHALIMLASSLAMLLPAALLLGMDMQALPVLALTLVLGVPVLALIGGVAGAVTVALHRNVALLFLLLIPFYVPVLVFAVSACDAAAIGGNVSQPLFFLAALLALFLPSGPVIIAAALRQGQG